MTPRVSVLMPTHNRADVIGVAIESVLRQTEGDFELLVAADGCTDDTVDRVSRLSDPRIRIFDLPKAPYFGYANRNVALRQARGRYLAFAAHDDLLLPDHLERLVDALERSGKEWIYSRPLWVSSDGVIVPSGTNLTNPDELEFFLTTANTIPASCVLYPRSNLDRYGYWPEDVPSAADWVHWRGMVEGGGRANFSYDREPTCLHFSANWRASRHAGVHEIKTALGVADTGAWWPAALRYSVPVGVPEQQVIADAMTRGGSTWVAEVREAVRTVLDRLAWDDLRAVRPRLESAESELGAVRAKAEAVQAALTASEAQHTTVRNSLSASQGQVAALRTELAESQVQVSALGRRIEAMQASTSWRITAPVRLLRRMARGDSRFWPLGSGKNRKPRA
jgi:hypothetical protein